MSFESVFGTILEVEALYNLGIPNSTARSRLWREYFLKGIRYELISDMSGNLTLKDTTNNKIIFIK